MRKISTEEVRSQWSYSRDPGPKHRTTEEWWKIRDDARAEFDRWLNQVKADAWDEVADNLGEYAEVDDSLIHLADNIRDGNPYREQEEA